MESKQEINTRLQQVFDEWQKLLAVLKEEQVIVPLLPSTWTIKDHVAHMWAWQQATVARAEAALLGSDPDYPAWWYLMGPDPEEDVDQTNAYLYQLNREKSWARVRTDWSAQFARCLELSRRIPEADLLSAGKYAWMRGFPLSASSMGTLNHHEEHLETVQAWLNEHGK
ncbi:MAG: ClbS/DfsB family four-helix bundle protein [Acidobacteriaceae bacterium]